MKKPSELALNDLTIFRGEKKAGILRRTDNGCEFTFDRQFLNDNEYSGLSFKMPKWQEPLKVFGTNLHPFFAGLLPEGLRMRTLVKVLKTSEDDLFTLFASAGSRVIGDVYVKNHTEEVQILEIPSVKEINFYDYFQQITSTNPSAVGEEIVAGVQEKISASMISFPMNIAKLNKTYILKLNPKDKQNLVQNEFQCMTLAGKCGIEIPKIKVVHDRDGNLGLLIERFDRQWDDKRKTHRMLHQEDACQFLGKYPADKYNLGFAEIAAGLQTITTAPRASILKLLRLYCFSYSIGNGDLHAKNISVLTQPDLQLTDLSPGYDILTTFIYSDLKMSNHFDGKKDNITRKMLLSFGERFDVNVKATVRMLDKLIHDLKKNRHLLDSIPIDEKKKISFNKFIEKRISDLAD